MRKIATAPVNECIGRHGTPRTALKSSANSHVENGAIHPVGEVAANNCLPAGVNNDMRGFDIISMESCILI